MLLPKVTQLGNEGGGAEQSNPSLRAPNQCVVCVPPGEGGKAVESEETQRPRVEYSLFLTASASDGAFPP